MLWQEQGQLKLLLYGHNVLVCIYSFIVSPLAAMKQQHEPLVGTVTGVKPEGKAVVSRYTPGEVFCLFVCLRVLG